MPVPGVFHPIMNRPATGTDGHLEPHVSDQRHLSTGKCPPRSTNNYARPTPPRRELCIAWLSSRAGHGRRRCRRRRGAFVPRWCFGQDAVARRRLVALAGPEVAAHSATSTDARPGGHRAARWRAGRVNRPSSHRREPCLLFGRSSMSLGADARRRRCPGSAPARRRGTRASGTPLTRRPSMRSSR